MKIAFIFMPFAFNGPPIVESGPRAIKWYIEKNNIFDSLDISLFEIKQEFNQSPQQHLSRLGILISEIYNTFNLIICFGGSHLSIMPLHEYMSTIEDHLCVIFDAHRDYYLGDISNASFLRYLDMDSAKKGERGIFGFRDNNESEFKLNFIYSRNEFVDFLNYIKSFFSKNPSSSCFLDIDLDIFNKDIFSHTYSIIENGIYLHEFSQILSLFDTDHLKLISFSEYSPYNDINNEGISFIIKLIKLFIKAKQNKKFN